MKKKKGPSRALVLILHLENVYLSLNSHHTSEKTKHKIINCGKFPLYQQSILFCFYAKYSLQETFLPFKNFTEVDKV